MSNQTQLSLSFRRGFLIFHVPSKQMDFGALKICHAECAMKKKYKQWRKTLLNRISIVFVL